MSNNILVSFIIPTINQVELVKNCVQSLLDSLVNCRHNTEIIVVDDGSPPKIKRELAGVLSSLPVRLIYKDTNNGFAKSVNSGAALAAGEFICLVNNDVTFPNDTWLDNMLKGARQAGVGVVGARLLYPNGLIQHAGVYYLPEFKTFDHEYRFRPSDYPPAAVIKEALAVTGALMLVEKSLWDELGGMDEKFFIALEDVDFSLRTWERGRRVLIQGESVALHHEGLTRGNSFANKDRFWLDKELKGIEYFFSKWGKKISLLEKIYKKKKRFTKKETSITQAQAMVWKDLAGQKVGRIGGS